MAKEPKPPKPWKRSIDLAERCKKGYKICCSNAPDGGEISYFLEPGGYPVGPKTVANALAHNLIVAQNDGLFGPDTSQTWVAA